MIIYVHGFAGAGQGGGKVIEFRTYFKSVNEKFIAPSFSYVPELVVSTLEELIESYTEEVTLIGSSLGALYTMYLAEKYGLRAVLINPALSSIRSLELFQKSKGYVLNAYDHSEFQWKDSHIEMLKMYEVEADKGKYLLLLQKGDEVLDYKDALAKFPHAEILLEEGGSHAFEKVFRHFKRIEKFLLN